MRKMVAVAILAIGCVFCGCGSKEKYVIEQKAEQEPEQEDKTVSRIRVTEQSDKYMSYSWFVLKDNETGVCYLVIKSSSGPNQIIRLEDKKETK